METIVIIGGGFAGLNLAKHLDENKHRICLVDRNNFHSFPPLFYQIASSGLVSVNISFPFRREIRNYRFYSTSLRLLLRPVKYPERRHWGD